MASEYVFVDEWEVEAPQEAVWDALADARTYPDWWKPVYIEVSGDCDPSVGCETQHLFKGKLPYKLKTTSKVTAADRPNTFETKVDGDLSGSGRWTLTPQDGRVHIRFDWIVFADRPLLRYLTPILRPVFRWNHNWSVQRAREGLQPYLDSRN